MSTFKNGAVRPIRTSLSLRNEAVTYALQRPRHSESAAVRFVLKMSWLESLRSRLKWLRTEAWTAANFCRLRMRRNLSIARYNHQNGFHNVTPHALA